MRQRRQESYADLAAKGHPQAAPGSGAPPRASWLAPAATAAPLPA